MAALLTIDFEASCLPKAGRSFPVEVALADLTGWSRAWLIRPDPAWAGWTWTAEAERLHGLSLDTLHRTGLPATQVAAELAEAVAGRRVLADSSLDTVWLATLNAAAGIAPAFRIDQIGALTQELGSTPDETRRAVDMADRHVPGRHRAAVDALWLAAVAGNLRDAALARPVIGPAIERPLFAWPAARTMPLPAGLLTA